MKENLIKFPKTVKIGPVTFDVIYPYKCVDFKFRGSMHSGKGYIRVSAESGPYTMSKQKILEVFLHEVMHSINSIYLGDAFEESDIEQLGKAFFEIIVCNNIRFCDDNIPKKLKIGGFVYDVLFPYEFEDTDTTEVLHSEPELKIMIMKYNNLVLNKLNFIFAMLKAISAHYLMSDKLDMDTLCFATATGVLDVFRDNNIEELIKGK